MKNIVLVGMAGCGKTTVAKALAKSLENFKLVDIDEEIEKSQNTTISNIFTQKGEEYFRKLEAETIEYYSNRPNQIISIGGGAFVSIKNRQNLQKNGITFYLNCPVEIIFDRIKNDNSRPLLQSQNAQKTLNDLFLKRKDFFEQAKYTINANRQINEITTEIIRIYDARNN